MSIRRYLGRPWGCKLFTTIGTLPLVVALSGCAGTPWGESLSGSFPSPPEQAPDPQQPTQDQNPTAVEAPPAPRPSAPSSAPEGAAGVAKKVGALPQGSAQPGTAPARPGPSTPQGSSARPPSAPKPKPEPSSSASSPYRVTIRLPLADPSAPAEGVTQALRAAGIPFEVETIERVKGAPAAPLPEANQGSPQPPSVRPTPPPR
ncbi:MAG: Translation initiation factor [Cyanobacteriota bacterium]|jgi:hypothetical protein